MISTLLCSLLKLFHSLGSLKEAKSAYYTFCTANEKSSTDEKKQKTRGVSIIHFYDNQQHLSPSPLTPDITSHTSSFGFYICDKVTVAYFISAM